MAYSFVGRNKRTSSDSTCSAPPKVTSQSCTMPISGLPGSASGPGSFGLLSSTETCGSQRVPRDHIPTPR